MKKKFTTSVTEQIFKNAPIKKTIRRLEKEILKKKLLKKFDSN
jgi:hypothetical protein